MPELGEDGSLYDTALVFNPHGELAAWHRKAHLYPPDARARRVRAGRPPHDVRRPVARRASGSSSASTATSPRWRGALALRGARLVLAPSRLRGGGARRRGTSCTRRCALTNSQWWLQANQAGSHATSTLLGASRIIAPTGTVVAEAQPRPCRAGRARPSSWCTASTCTSPTAARAWARLLEDERRPDLYAELVEQVPARGVSGAACIADAARPAIGRVAAVAGSGTTAVSLYEGLLTTRAIRRYTDETVPDEALRDILFAATRAPSGSNRQPFRFIVLTDGPVAAEAKRLIGAGARRFWAAKRAEDGYDKGSGAEADSPKARLARTMQHYVDDYESVPVLVLACFVRYRATPPAATAPRSTRPARTCCWPPAPSATAAC